MTAEEREKADHTNVLPDTLLNSALMEATKYGRMEDVKRVLTAGASIEAVDPAVRIYLPYRPL